MQRVIPPKMTNTTRETAQVMYTACAAAHGTGFVWWLATLDEGTALWQRTCPEATQLFDLADLTDIFEDPDMIIGSADADVDLETLRIVEIVERTTITLFDATEQYINTVLPE